MKIRAIQTYKFSVPTGQSIRDPKTGELLSSTAKPWLFLKVETDGDIIGWGEGSGEWLVPSVETTIHEWTELIVGQDPLEVRRLCEDITDRLPWKGGPVFGTAIAAINMALYDIAGKAWGVPVHTILGGKRRNRIRVYGGATLFGSPKEAVKNARTILERGYGGVKGNPLEDRAWPLDYGAVEHATSCVAALRNDLGPRFDILLDAHGSPSPELSIEFARAVAPYRPLFLEEPLKVGSLEALCHVSSKSPVPIAVGEKLFALRDFIPLIDARACAFLQPDVGHCFGISGLMDIARYAELSQILMAPHMAGGPIQYAAALHADAAMNNFLIQESPMLDHFSACAEHDWHVEDGYLKLSASPGLGVAVKEQDLAEMEYQPLPFRQYRHEDGSWKGW